MTNKVNRHIKPQGAATGALFLCLICKKRNLSSTFLHKMFLFFIKNCL